MMVFSLRFRGFRLLREPAGVLADVPVWVFLDEEGYLYLDERLSRLLRQVVFEWRHDRHLVG